MGFVLLPLKETLGILRAAIQEPTVSPRPSTDAAHTPRPPAWPPMPPTPRGRPHPAASRGRPQNKPEQAALWLYPWAVPSPRGWGPLPSLSWLPSSPTPAGCSHSEGGRDLWLSLSVVPLLLPWHLNPWLSAGHVPARNNLLAVLAARVVTNQALANKF